MTIPKNIFQTWKSKRLPEKYANWAETWKSTNPEFKYYLYDDNDCYHFIKNYYSSYLRFYESLNPVEKADIFRYLILHKYGGVYADIDTSCLRPINLLIKMFPCSIITGYEYNSPIQYLQWFIACPKGSNTMIELVNEAYRRSWYTMFKKRTNQIVYYKTGPVLYTDILRKSEDTVVVLEKGVLGCFDKTKISDRSYLQHHFEGSWK
jgi:mannosyltransferase OCH1-like enzyme